MNTVVYYATGPYSEAWPYLMVRYNAKLKPIGWRFDDNTDGVGALDYQNIPLEIVESIQEVPGHLSVEELPEEDLK